MTEIKRTGPPTTADGDEWTVPLNAEPERSWVRRFNEPGDSAPAPEGVRFHGRGAIFRSSPEQVPRRVQDLDGWIESANRRVAETRGEQARQSALKAEANEAERQRVRDLNQRFKDL